MSTITAPSTDRPVVKITVKTLTYLSARAEVTTIHHDKGRFGLRTVRMRWIDDASAENGGWPAGTTTEKVIKGNGWKGPKFEIIEAEKVVA